MRLPCRAARFMAGSSGTHRVAVPCTDPEKRTAAMSGVKEILAGYDALRGEQEAFYKDL
jgi:hypothetical protein